MSDSTQQDLSQLEMAFAADPKAFVPLTTAYLQLGRFMEAMVVCKKGIKAMPDSVDGKLLLARVYAEQGKTPKAIEEVKAALATPDLKGPPAAAAHFLLGTLHEKSGRFEEAIESFKEALRQDRSHSDAKQALRAKGVDFDPGPSAEEIAAAKAAEDARRAAEAQAAAAAAAEAAAAEAAARSAQEAKARAMGQAISGAPRSSTPPTGSQPAPSTSTSSAPQPVDPAFAAAYAQNLYGYPGPQAQQNKKGLGFGFTFGLGALLLLVVVGVVAGLKINRDRQMQVKTLLEEQIKLTKKDTALGHKKALEKLEAALAIDDSQDLAVSQYAYSLNILAERGMKEAEGPKVDKATAEAAKKAKNHPLSVAARMIHARVAGKPEEAVALALAQGDPKTLSIPIRAELGRAYAALGKVQEMREMADSLKDSPDANALAFAGDAYRRIGEVFKARQALDGAIKTELDHDVARALRAMLILEQDDVVNLPVALDDVTVILDAGKDNVGSRQRGYATLGRALIAERARAGDNEVKRDIEAARLLLRNDPEMPLFDAKQAKEDKEYDKALESLKAAIAIDKYRLAPYLMQVEVAARAKKFAEADAALTAAQQIFGDNLEVGLAKGQRLLAEQKADDALAHLQGMLKTMDIAEVHRDIGKVFMLKGDFPNAVAELKKAAEKSSTRGPGIQANVYTWLGRAFAKAGDHSQAAATYSEALAITSEFPSTYYWLGISLQELGKNDGAKDALGRYLKAEPNGNYSEDAKARVSGL
jgi:tetratricopeptide (TPR) repeat protein